VAHVSGIGSGGHVRGVTLIPDPFSFESHGSNLSVLPGAEHGHSNKADVSVDIIHTLFWQDKPCNRRSHDVQQQPSMKNFVQNAGEVMSYPRPRPMNR
jgi:hypothetical protein